MSGDNCNCRPPLVYWTSLWGIGLAVPLVGIATELLVHSRNFVIGRDFSNLWSAGRLVIEGRTSCIFEVGCFRTAVAHYVGVSTVQNYSYPPHALFMAVPFSIFPYYLSLALWTIAGAAFFLFAARDWLPSGMPRYAAILTPAAAINMWNGHYGFIVGGLWFLYFAYADKRPVAAGIAAGLLTFKPHMGLLVFAKSLPRRRVLVAAAAATAVLAAASAATFGTGSWALFATSTIPVQASILAEGSGTFYNLMMPSAYVAGGHGLVGAAAQCLFAVAAAATLVAYRRLDAFSAATATFLIVPYVFNYDMTVACLGFAILLFDRWPVLSIAERSILSLAFLVPELTYDAPTRLLCPPVLLAALLIQCRHAPASLQAAKQAIAANQSQPVPALAERREQRA